MVASSTLHLDPTQPLQHFWRQMIYAILGLLTAFTIWQFPLSTWQRLSTPLLILNTLLLLALLIPNLGYAVNGSLRWLKIGPLQFQPAELLKITLTLYLANTLTPHLQLSLKHLLIPLLLIIPLSYLLLLQPDYGTLVVLLCTALGLIFLAGLPTPQFWLIFTLILTILSLTLLLAPYRIERLIGFLNPWEDPFDSGFQLTQALIAIGRGELFGVGLSNGIQKITYLPEAHTDFLFAVLAEELGLLGVILLISLFTLIILRSFAIAAKAQHLGLNFAAHLAHGLALSLALQACLYLRVNMGLLATKGLTLPLMSYGGTSLIVSLTMLALLLRIDYENQLHHPHTRPSPH